MRKSILRICVLVFMNLFNAFMESYFVIMLSTSVGLLYLY